MGINLRPAPCVGSGGCNLGETGYWHRVLGVTVEELVTGTVCGECGGVTGETLGTGTLLSGGGWRQGREHHPPHFTRRQVC